MTYETNMDRWQNPEVLKQYKEGRAITAGLIERQIASTLLPYLRYGGKIVEFGAGGGALADIMHSHLPGKASWLETDQTPHYLREPRASDREQRVIELPNVPLEDSSVDTVIGLSTFDTLSPEVLSASMQQFARILKPEGHVVHLLDLVPNTDDLTKAAAARGLLALPCALRSDEGEVLGSGLVYVPREKLRTMLYILDQPDEVRGVLSRLIHDYEETFYMIGSNNPEIFDFLATALKTEGLVTDTVNLWEDFSAQMLSAAQAAGLESLKAEVQEAEMRITPEQLAPQIPPDTALIERRFGVPFMKRREEVEIKQSQVVIRSNLLVHVFHKTELEGS